MIFLNLSKTYRVDVITCIVYYIPLFLHHHVIRYSIGERQEWRCRWKCTYLEKYIDVYFLFVFWSKIQGIKWHPIRTVCFKCRETDTLRQIAGKQQEWQEHYTALRMAIIKWYKLEYVIQYFIHTHNLIVRHCLSVRNNTHMHVTLHKIVVLVITKYTSENSMLDNNNNIHTNNTKNDNIIIKILFSVHKKKYCTQQKQRRWQQQQRNNNSNNITSMLYESK